MVPPKAPLIPTAKPKHFVSFDPWSSSCTGHQRTEVKADSSIGWRISRTAKLTAQFGGGAVKEKETASSFGLKSKNVLCTIGNIAAPPGDLVVAKDDNNIQTLKDCLMKPIREKRIFDRLVIYINGSTYPLISDHKLRHLLAEHGAKVSVHLGRKEVTHVIIGTPSQLSRSGAGGGLAAGKMQKEIEKVGGYGIKYVGVEWVLESVRAGRRLSEAQFVNMKLSLNGQETVRNIFRGVQSSCKADPPEKKELTGG